MSINPVQANNGASASFHMSRQWPHAVEVASYADECGVEKDQIKNPGDVPGGKMRGCLES